MRASSRKPEMDALLWLTAVQSGTLISQLKSVQRFAARLVTKRWSSPPDQLIHSLNWSILQTRRKNTKGHNLQAHPLGPLYLSYPHSLLIPHPNPNPRRHYSYTLTTPFARTSLYQSSFFISCTHLIVWNCLPDSIVCPPSTYFCCNL